MKSYRFFTIGTCFLLVVYIIANIYKPKPINWNLTLQKADKNPLGGYVLYDQLSNIFSKASIGSYREPVYNRLHNNSVNNTAYLLLGPSLNFSDFDVNELVRFVSNGNSVLLSTFSISDNLSDTLGVHMDEEVFVQSKKSAYRFVSPLVTDTTSYYDLGNKLESHAYFDSLKNKNPTTILGVNSSNKPNFIQIKMGKGVFYIHATPIVFSNYFLLYQKNAQYTATVLSFLPKETETIYWDEYAKLGRSGAQTPLRFFLDHSVLRWVLWLSVIGMLLFVFFNGKRVQRIIPIIEPLSNATLDFVKTIAGLYYNQKDNNSIAKKRLQFWLEFVRNRFHISTENVNEAFVASLSKKANVEASSIQTIIKYIPLVEQSKISNEVLLKITQQIDEFYKQTK